MVLLPLMGRYQVSPGTLTLHCAQHASVVDLLPLEINLEVKASNLPSSLGLPLQLGLTQTEADGRTSKRRAN